MLVIIVVYYGHFATEVAKIVAKSEAFCNHFATRETQCDSAERGRAVIGHTSTSFHKFPSLLPITSVLSYCTQHTIIRPCGSKMHCMKIPSGS